MIQQRPNLHQTWGDTRQSELCPGELLSRSGCGARSWPLISGTNSPLPPWSPSVALSFGCANASFMVLSIVFFNVPVKLAAHPNPVAVMTVSRSLDSAGWGYEREKSNPSSRDTTASLDVEGFGSRTVFFLPFCCAFLTPFAVVAFVLPPPPFLGEWEQNLDRDLEGGRDLHQVCTITVSAALDLTTLLGPLLVLLELLFVFTSESELSPSSDSDVITFFHFEEGDSRNSRSAGALEQVFVFFLPVMAETRSRYGVCFSGLCWDWTRVALCPYMLCYPKNWYQSSWLILYNLVSCGRVGSSHARNPAFGQGAEYRWSRFSGAAWSWSCAPCTLPHGIKASDMTTLHAWAET